MWNDWIDAGRSAGRNFFAIEGVPVDHNSHLSIPGVMSSGKAEYTSTTTACMRAKCLQMRVYDLKYLCTLEYDGNNLNHKPIRIIIDNII